MFEAFRKKSSAAEAALIEGESNVVPIKPATGEKFAVVDPSTNEFIGMAENQGEAASMIRSHSEQSREAA